MENSGDGSVEDCFKGARIEKNGVLVNQYVSCSFDPATLVCITCSKEHGILEGGEGPECFVLSDQNFVATLPGSDTKKCLKIVRLENSNLVELATLFMEIFEGKNLVLALVSSFPH